MVVNGEASISVLLLRLPESSRLNPVGGSSFPALETGSIGTARAKQCISMSTERPVATPALPLFKMQFKLQPLPQHCKQCCTRFTP